jgi:hypothetical protein
MTFVSSSSTAQKFKFDSCSIDRSKTTRPGTEQPRRAQPSSIRRVVDGFDGAFAFVVALAGRARRGVTRVVFDSIRPWRVCFDDDES